MTKEILDALLAPKDGRHLGDLVGWSLHGKYQRDQVEQLTDRLGLAEDFQFPRLTPVNAYRRAAREACRESGVGADEQMWSVELVQNDKDYIVHEFLRKEIRDGSGSTMTDKTTSFTSETRIRFDRNCYRNGGTTEALVELEHPEHPVAQRAAKLYRDHLELFRADDLRSGFQRAFHRWGGMRILDHGGLWMVPEPFALKVRAWKQWMEELRCTPFIVPVFDTQETVATMQAMAVDTLEGQLQQITEELEAFTHKDNVKLETLEKRLNAFDDLRSKTEMYERLLDLQLDNLKGRLHAAADSLKTSLASI